MSSSRRPIEWGRVYILLGTMIGTVLIILISIIYFYPFLIAIAFSLLFLPFVNYLENNWNWNRTSATLIIISIFILIFLALTTFIIAEFVQGLSHLMKILPPHIEESTEVIHLWIDNVILPFVTDLTKFSAGLATDTRATIDLSLDQLFSNAGNQIGELIQYVLAKLRNFFISLPHAFAMILFSLLASFFITKDWPRLMYFIDKYLPLKVNHLTNNVFHEWKKAMGSYLLAQATLVIITGLIVLVGLLILKVEYAYTTALLLALVDIVPYVGTGIIFIPWIIFSFFNGSWSMAIGLSILYGVVVVQRQVSEPKLIAHHMGMPTLLLLFTMFACYQFLGFIGVLFGPFLLMIIQSFIRANVLQEIYYFIRP
ncbi:sporulation integral membrane protein YtvI [Salipaludibacillus neizhouensis]|uniref:Sporulation integral membrane protein YtvI n=1 Tax=Salipaludibacillus neizhouensis TaxID=885475 RepID=A0A3A9KAV0_9BACI|nr:sporulation integral membrane protein YtvI [Salipaludibacillus neizhouensis]RKL66703.1 sporulation integral membrane protein YtvI [Salipaludibacillus neizhouensis]